MKQSIQLKIGEILTIFDTGSDEQKFLEASMAYVSGNPILTDEEFDELKLRLKVYLNELQFKI